MVIPCVVALPPLHRRAALGKGHQGARLAAGKFASRRAEQGGFKAMDSTDAADLIAEIHEERAENEAADTLPQPRRLADRLLAAVLAIGGLGGGNATDDMIGNNIKASDTWAFYQAKNVRQTMYEIAAPRAEGALAAGARARRRAPSAEAPAQGLSRRRSPATTASPIRARTTRCRARARRSCAPRPRPMRRRFEEASAPRQQFRLRRGAAAARSGARLGRDPGGQPLDPRPVAGARRRSARC